MSCRLIVAVDEDSGIGREGQIPWRCREDMRHFRNTTLGCTVVMGRHTWESIDCRPLSDRTTLVLSTADPPVREPVNRPGPRATPGKVVFAKTMDAAKEYLSTANVGGGVWVAGGTTIYDEFLRADMVSELHITRIPGTYGCDRTFCMPAGFTMARRWELCKRDDASVMCEVWSK